MALTQSHGVITDNVARWLDGRPLAELARRLAWPYQKLRRRMRGETPWSVDDLILLAAVLDVPLEQLVAPAAAVAS